MNIRLICSAALLGVVLVMLSCAGAPAGIPPQQAAEPDAFILDHRDPRSVVEAILYAAQTGDIDVMCNLCDPRLMNDEKTEDLCFIMEEDVPRFRKEYGNATIAGEIEFQYEYARVTLAGTGGGGQTDIVLVARYGNWYLFEID
jgi:hypothetical protein